MSGQYLVRMQFDFIRGSCNAPAAAAWVQTQAYAQAAGLALREPSSTTWELHWGLA